MDVKICGLCRPADAALAMAYGATHLGVVLAPGGRRSRSLAEAAEIFAAAPGPKRVGVFVDATAEELAEAGRRLGLDVLQLHGGESPEVVEAMRHAGPWAVWKALRPRSREEFLDGVARYGAVADGLLLDGWSARAAGGTGAVFPWDEVAAVRDAVPPDTRLVVAGGLSPENVATAVARLRPDGVDVSSGVEQRVGQKSPERMKAFITRAREAASGEQSQSTSKE